MDQIRQGQVLKKPISNPNPPTEKQPTLLDQILKGRALRKPKPLPPTQVQPTLRDQLQKQAGNLKQTQVNAKKPTPQSQSPFQQLLQNKFQNVIDTDENDENNDSDWEN